MIKDILWMLLMLALALSGVFFTDNPSYMGIVILSFLFGIVSVWMCGHITLKLISDGYKY